MPLIGWGLLAGGALFVAGGAVHPDEQSPGLGVKEHLRILFLDSAWYPSHALLLVGLVLLAVSLVALVRGGALAAAPLAHRVGVGAAAGAVLAALGMVPHLVAASEADRIAAGQGTGITDIYVVAETVTVPVFGFGIAALAVVGAVTATLGDRVTAALGVIGGVAYGLAGGSFAFTDRLTVLFPAAAGIGLWTMAAGIGLVLRHQVQSSTRSLTT